MRITLISCLILITIAAAQQTAPVGQAPAAPGAKGTAGRGGRGGPAGPPLPNTQWVKLFNGTDLTGWEPVGNQKWSVENGVIHGNTVDRGYGYLQTTKDYKDFELSLRFRCVGDGNSGVFFHSRFKPGTAEITQGLQFEIDPTPNNHSGGIYGDGRQWIVWPAVENEFVLRQQDWNEYMLIVRANRYISRMNGVVMVDFTDPTPRSFDGTIALQLHSGGNGNMEFKDIYIRDASVR